MTDFLDLLEADLRDAAERRGQPRPRRRRPSAGAFKAIAVMAVAALCVVGAARLLDRADTDEHPAQRLTATPTPFVLSHVRVIAATEGDPGLVDVMSATLGGSVILDRDSVFRTADPSLGTVVLYLPEAHDASGKIKQTAEQAAFAESIDEVRPITKADEAKLDFNPFKADVIVVYGREREQRMLDDPKVCAPAGGDYKLCVSRSDEQRFSVLVRGSRSVVTAPRDWWSWAALSPDGNSMLIEESSRCEVPHTAIWDLATNAGEVVPTGVAQPLGWTTDGRAILFVPEPMPDAADDCRANLPAGLYLVKPGEDPTRVGDQPVPKSLDPRTPQEITG
jgi:hypothetical protein